MGDPGSTQKTKRMVMKGQLKRRMRINRAHASTRNLVAESQLHPHDFIAPLFIVHGTAVKEEISSMPDYYRYSIDQLSTELEELKIAGIQSVLLFVKEEDAKKDNTGAYAADPNGLMQCAIKYIKVKLRVVIAARIRMGLSFKRLQIISVKLYLPSAFNLSVIK